MKRRENMENVTIIKKDMKKINKIEKRFSKYKLRENTIPNHRTISTCVSYKKLNVRF